jgi:hypothetical protein
VEHFRPQSEPQGILSITRERQEGLCSSAEPHVQGELLLLSSRPRMIGKQESTALRRPPEERRRSHAWSEEARCLPLLHPLRLALPGQQLLLRRQRRGTADTSRKWVLYAAVRRVAFRPDASRRRRRWSAHGRPLRIERPWEPRAFSLPCCALKPHALSGSGDEIRRFIGVLNHSGELFLRGEGGEIDSLGKRREWVHDRERSRRRCPSRIRADPHP